MSVKIMLKGTVEDIERFEREILYPGLHLANEAHGSLYFKITQNTGRYFDSTKSNIKVRYWGGYFPDKQPSQMDPPGVAGELCDDPDPTLRIMLKGVTGFVDRFECEMLYPIIRLASEARGDPAYFTITQKTGIDRPTKQPMVTIRWFGGRFIDQMPAQLPSDPESVSDTAGEDPALRQLRPQ